LLGLLIYKPQLGLLIPVALLAGRWRASEGVAVSFWVNAMSLIGTFRTWRDVCHEFVMRGKADIGQRAGMATGWAR
jgi:hypothetical protein